MFRGDSLARLFGKKYGTMLSRLTTLRLARWLYQYRVAAAASLWIVTATWEGDCCPPVIVDPPNGFLASAVFDLPSLAVPKSDSQVGASHRGLLKGAKTFVANPPCE